ncbi:MAG: hypothetical protein FJW34_00205 [Acidobacteria bacterium]|nr:hypothetical protein [Acidobacteriota bacterium]
MEVLIKQGEGCRFATLREVVDEILMEVSSRVNHGNHGAEQADIEIEQALSAAGKVDELAAKVTEIETRLKRLEAEGEP